MKRNFHQNLKGISVCGAFAYMLATGEQGSESRRSPTKHRGWTCIHVPVREDWDDTFPEFGVDPKTCPKRTLIGAIRIDDCYEDRGAYHLLAGDHILFPKPIPGVRGHRQVVWTPTEESWPAFNQAWAILEETFEKADLLEDMNPATYRTI